MHVLALRKLYFLRLNYLLMYWANDENMNIIANTVLEIMNSHFLHSYLLLLFVITNCYLL